MRLDALQAYLSVVENGSISEAARKLHLSQPAVSSIISSLEKEVGQALIIRHIRGKKPLEVTKAGAIFMRYALRTLELYREMETEIAAAEEIPDNIILGCGRSNSVHILPAIVMNFKYKYPNIQVNAKTYTNTYFANEKLRLMECNVCISNFVPGTNDFVAQNILYDPFVFICPINMNIKENITVNSLKKLPLIIRSDSIYSHGLFTGSLAQHGLSLSDLNVVMEVFGDSAVKQAVSMGVGCGFIPKSLAYIGLPIHPTFKIVQIKNFKFDRYIYLVRNKNAPYTQSLKFFCNYVCNTDWSKKIISFNNTKT